MGSRILGINGLGRIGKLTLWYHLPGDTFAGFVVNVGRDVGTSLESIAQYLAKDSTYGPLHRWLEGRRGARAVEVVDEPGGLLRMHGKEVRILREARNPKDIPWRDHGVQVVVDATGRFTDPTAPAEQPGGSLRGHLAGGAKVVVLSAPFKIKGERTMPADAVMLINGINDHQFDPTRHRVVSTASCTTTALAHMVRPLLDRDVTRNMMTAGMSTVHATTNSQSVLDAVPKAGAKDLRKTRSVLNNIILTSTGAAKALEQVMPEIGRIGFMADSVRIPTTTGSLIILNLTFQTEMTLDGRPSIDKDVINAIYREAAGGPARDLLTYTEEQNVSADMVGEDAAVVIEAAETHTRTGFIQLRLPADLSAAPAAPEYSLVGAAGAGSSGRPGGPGPGDGPIPPPPADGDSGDGQEARAPEDREATAGPTHEVRIPVTHVKVFGWYDNELGSYTARCGEVTAAIAAGL